MINRRTSVAWKHFTDLRNGTARCNTCKKVLSYEKSGASNLVRHTVHRHGNKKKKKPENIDIVQDNFDIIEEQATTSNASIRVQQQPPQNNPPVLKFEVVSDIVEESEPEPVYDPPLVMENETENSPLTEMDLKREELELRRLEIQNKAAEIKLKRLEVKSQMAESKARCALMEAEADLKRIEYEIKLEELQKFRKNNITKNGEL